jgi:hypothetical protein
MAISKHLDTWNGLPVVDWAPELTPLNATTAYRIRAEWDGSPSWVDRLTQFVDQPGSESVTTLVVGFWGFAVSSDGTICAQVVEAIASAREHLPNLTALFFGDVTYQECEISWMAMADMAPLFHAYPQMQHFVVRGGMRDNQDLTLGILKHTELQSLEVQTGGLNVRIVEEICHSELPALESLKLYLGTEEYGGTVEIADLQPILYHGHEKWPKLTYLGLMDYEQADALAMAITTDGGVPVLEKLHTLDLSLGTLGNAGTEALTACPAIARLKKLDIHHHYASEEAVEKLKALGIEVDDSDAQGEIEGIEDEEDDFRYVAVSE